MTSRIMCLGIAVVLALTTGALGLNTSNIGDLLNGLTPDQLNQLTSLLGSGGTSSLLGGTGTSATSQPATSQPSNSLDSRIGSPSVMISAAIAEHTQFNAVGRMTPADQRTALGITTPATQTKIPVIYLLKAAVDLGANFKIPIFETLQKFLDGVVLPTPGSNVTPPTPVTGKGIVVYLTADETTINKDQTTTGHVWVQQTSPNSTKTNGVYSVAVNIDVSTSNIVTALAPATLYSPWTQSVPGVSTGTPSTGGGLTGVAGNLGVSQKNTVGIGDPVLVASFEIKGTTAGNVTLSATNYTEHGWTGVAGVLINSVAESGDEKNYVPVEITVK